jgi:dTDP-4-dehydrorhamnose reductase
MTILVTGARGTVGGYYRELASSFGEPLEVAGREDLDVTRLEDVERWFERKRYTLVINLAAATDLDRAEKEPEWAYRLNVVGPWNLALAAEAQGATIVHYSTVGMFGKDGAMGPFSEGDVPNPVNVYASTKYAGEQRVATHASKHFIVRTAWVFGGGVNDKKFIGKLREKLLKGEPIRAVGDKVGSPTFAGDLVDCVRELVATRAYGLYHVTNKGSASRYDIAVELKRLLSSKSDVTACKSDEFPLPAARPPSEVSHAYALTARGLGDKMPTWQDALARYLETWPK